MTGDVPMILAWDFPNPITWTADKISGFMGDMAEEGFEAVIGGLVAWVMDAVIWIVGGVFNFFLDAQDPNVQADWFIGDKSPYATTAAMGSILMVGFALAGIAQGAMQGDVSGMLRRMAVDLPASVLGIVGLVTITQALIRLTDVLSGWVMAEFEEQIADFSAVILSLSSVGGHVATAFVVFALGSMTVMAGLVLVAELAIRAALVYIVVALAPLVFAAQLWPALRGVSQKLLRLICGLVVAKLAMAIALAVASAAAVGSGSGGEVTTLPEPEVFAEDPGGSVTQAVGVLLAAAVAFGVAAYMPFLVVKLLPLAEEAAVGQGVRGGPMRALQQGMSLMYYGQTLPRLTSGWPPGSARAGPGGRSPRGPGSGGSGSGGGGSGGPGRRPSNPRGPQPGGGPGTRRTGSNGSASRRQGTGRSGQTAGRPGGGASASGSRAQAAGVSAAAGPAGAAAGAAGPGAGAGGSAASSGSGGRTPNAPAQGRSPASLKAPGRAPRTGPSGGGE